MLTTQEPEAPPAEAPQEAPDHLAEVMDRSVRFVMIRLVGVPGHRKVPGTRVMLNDAELSRTDFSDPTLRLLTPEWRSKFNHVKWRAEQIVGRAHAKKVADVDEADSEAASEFSIPGVDVVAASRLEDIEAQLETLRQQILNPLVGDLTAAYPALVARLKDRIPDEPTWQAVCRKLPKAAELKTRIALRFVTLPLTFLSSAGRRFAEGVAQNLIRGISKGLAEEVSRIQERVREEGSFKSGTFTVLRQKFQALRDFSFLASPDTLRQLGEAESAFSTLGDGVHVALNLDMKTAEKSIVNGLTDVLGRLTKEVRKDSAGRFRRTVQFDGGDDNE